MDIWSGRVKRLCAYGLRWLLYLSRNPFILKSLQSWTFYPCISYWTKEWWAPVSQENELLDSLSWALYKMVCQTFQAWGKVPPGPVLQPSQWGKMSFWKQFNFYSLMCIKIGHLIHPKANSLSVLCHPAGVQDKRAQMQDSRATQLQSRGHLPQGPLPTAPTGRWLKDRQM